jgi:hypothetical protein
MDKLIYPVIILSFFSLHAIGQDEEDKKVNVNGLHFFHQYSFENSVAEFSNHQPLKAKTAFSIMPIFGVGIKRETENYVFAFSSRFGFQRDNMTFSYAGQKLAGTYAMDYMSVKRQFAFGLKITPQQTFSFLFISSYNYYGMGGATPFGERINLRKLEQKDKLELSMSYDPFFDFRIGFEYELKPMDEAKLRLFFHLESSLKQRRVEVAPSPNLGIDQHYTLNYRLSVFGFGLRF